MATLAEFTVPSESFPLGSIFQNHPGVTVELDRVIPTSRAIIPYFWVRGISDTEEADIEAAFRDHPDVTNIRLVDEIGGGYLIRVEWRTEYQGILKAIVETDVVLVSGTGTHESWHFEVRADERGAIADFQGYSREHDIPLELLTMHSLSEVATEPEYGLTDTQREALILAYDRGYYQSPREVTLDELAADLGITGQAFGSRLRRGIHHLVGRALVTSA
jgi:predicted DNA binding protein